MFSSPYITAGVPRGDSTTKLSAAFICDIARAVRQGIIHAGAGNRILRTGGGTNGACGLFSKLPTWHHGKKLVDRTHRTRPFQVIRCTVSPLWRIPLPHRPVGRVRALYCQSQVLLEENGKVHFMDDVRELPIRRRSG